jgi:hypothetical protein
MATVDRASLLDVQCLSGRNSRRIVNDDDTASAFLARERVSDGAAQFSGSDDANGRHESVEYSS